MASTSPPSAWRGYPLFRHGASYALFDPVGLESVVLREEEVVQLMAGDLAPLAQVGLEAHFPGANGNSPEALRRRLRALGVDPVPGRVGGCRLVITDKCNMRCAYCFVETNTGKCDMGVAELEAALEFLAAQNEGREGITYQWFGGEPTVRFDLMQHGDAFVSGIVERYRIMQFQPTLVTNGVRITDEMIRHFVRFNYGVGVSLDGPPALNTNRRLLNGKPADDRIYRNIARMVEAGIDVSCNLTPTAEAIAQLPEIVSYLMDRRIRFVYVNSPIPIGGRWWVSGNEFARSLFRARWLALSRGGMVFSLLDRVYQALDSRIPRVYEHLQHDGSIVIAVLPGGRWSLTHLGWHHEALVHDLDELRRNPALLSKAAKELAPHERCASCDAIAICGGPSVNDQLLRRTREPDPEMCAFYEEALKLCMFDDVGLQ